MSRLTTVGAVQKLRAVLADKLAARDRLTAEISGLEVAIDTLNGHAAATAAAALPAKLDAAIALRAGSRRRKRTHREVIAAHRATSAALLAKAEAATGPLPGSALGGPRVGALVRRGYLKKTDEGYVRTTKVFTP
jgi:hypothetical protein